LPNNFFFYFLFFFYFYLLHLKPIQKHVLKINFKTRFILFTF